MYLPWILVEGVCNWLKQAPKVLNMISDISFGLSLLRANKRLFSADINVDFLPAVLLWCTIKSVLSECRKLENKMEKFVKLTNVKFDLLNLHMNLFKSYSHFMRIAYIRVALYVSDFFPHQTSWRSKHLTWFFTKMFFWKMSNEWAQTGRSFQKQP